MGLAALINAFITCATSAIFRVEATKRMGSPVGATDGIVFRPTPFRRIRRSSHVPAFLRIRTSSAVSTSRNLERDTALSTLIGCHGHVTKIRGGSSSSSSSDEEEEEEEEECDEDEESSDDSYGTDSEMNETDDGDEEEESDSYDEEQYEEEAVAMQSYLKSSILSKSHDSSDSKSKNMVEYDDLLVPPAMQQLGVTIGVLLLANRIDIFNAKTVQIARYAFLTYMISVQLFLLYVRFRAKSINDQTPITISNPLATLVLNGASSDGASGGGGNFMVKALAGQFLSTQTTVLEYDLKEAMKMNGGLVFPMVFLYFLHFKMKQVQPLLMQTATGVLNLVYSPLFQVYIMGKNLERPFKPPVNPMLEAMQGPQEIAGDGENEGDEESVLSAEDDVDEENKNEGETDEVSQIIEEEQNVCEDEEDSDYDHSDE